jgi:5-methylcytosine-specific restriction enzyme A
LTSPAYNARQYKRNRLLALERAAYCCEVRGPRCSGRATTADHVRALAEGGTNTLDNLRAACGPCNSGLGADLANARRRGRSLGRSSRAW